MPVEVLQIQWLTLTVNGARRIVSSRLRSTSPTTVATDSAFTRKQTAMAATATSHPVAEAAAGDPKAV